MTRTEILKTLSANLKKIGLEKMKEKVGKTFFDMDHVVEVLYRGIISHKNIILYGPGGFGKTTIVKEFLKQANINYSTIVGYEDMDVEGLLGIPNMDKLLNKSIYETAFDRTAFANPGILILEEFLDVNPKTAIALKDIITEGGLRQGGMFTESKVASIIICSNKSPYELSTDHSTTAFYKERFPIVCNLSWKDFSYERYEAYLQKIIPATIYNKNKETYTVLAELAYRTSEENAVVSPRVVKDAAEFLKANDFKIETLKLIDGLNTEIIDEVFSAVVYRTEESKLQSIKYRIQERVEDILGEPTMSSRYIIDSITELRMIMSKLTDMHLNDVKHLGFTAELKKYCDANVNILWSKLKMKEGDFDNLENIFK